MAFANVEKITLVKQIEIPLQGGQNMIIPLKVLSQQGIYTNISTMSLPGKFYVTPLKKTDIHKNLEVIFIALLKPSLNEQKNFEHLILFRNVVT